MSTIDHYGDVPVYQQLAAILRKQIASGELAPQRPIPSKATLMQEYSIAGGTIDRAVAVLKAEGLVKTVPGRGIYVVPVRDRPKR